MSRTKKRGGPKGARGRGGNQSRGSGRGTVVDTRVSFENVPKTNEKMEQYYNSLNIVPDGEERQAFWDALRRELPNSFRFTGSKGHALSVRDNLVERFFPLISQITHENRPVALPVAMPWYPEGLAYSMVTPKNVVRKYEPFKEFQRFLVSETGVGNISRQEAVSMIPPLVMDLQPNHTCLDLCAAPGSKTAQLIEMIHAGEETRVGAAIARAASGDKSVEGDIGADDGRSEGLLIANDVNYKRAQMLTHQVKRLNSPNLIVTNHDATMYPSIELPPVSATSKVKRYLKFDRILADVPCSGDGTCRKNPGIWKDWSPQNGMGLYITQVRILTRSLQMLKVGGRVVYSTCSMNPIEDEAVISSAIERCGGVSRVKLIDCSDKLPKLIRSPGLQDWSIMSRSGQIFESWAEAQQFDTPESRIVPGMFAPDAAENIPLQHCMRVYPHQQDTGGFFIAVLEKLREIAAKPENESKCFQKDWQLKAETKQAEQTEQTEPTAFSELLHEVETEPMDENGHLHKEHANVQAEPEMSSAQRQNIDSSIISSATMQRLEDGSDDFATSSSKRLKMVSSEAQDATDKTAMQSREQSDNDPQRSIPTVTNNVGVKRKRDQDAQVESFKYLPAEHSALQSIYEFYDLHPSFPRDRFLVRNPAGDPVKGIYYSSQLAKDILVANEHRKMKFVHGGVKMFQKQDSQGQDICPWRIQTEGLPIIEGWVGEGRVVRLNRKSTLHKLLSEMFLKVGKNDQEETGWRALGEIGPQVRDIGMGCCVLRVEPSDDPDGFNEALTLPLWRSLYSVNLMLPKEDRKAMVLRIFNEEIEVINHTELRKLQERSAANNHSNGDHLAMTTMEDAVADQSQPELDEDGNAPMVEAEAEDEEAGLDHAAVAMQDDADARQNHVESQKQEYKEDENNKIVAAMPEREGEGDEYNTTI